ncbi:DUF642 domain-containing protein [Paenibacillus nasutitermitis]|uniref:DUF642 domain-containing protein n=1 Tax=Paenibacillus nasutitermitis TaxID=1652958 RepID=A0A917DP31_9BACL|nr:DUF642 domain-containing protein [Paenibacillus nasutitermitis]GGD52813.1 hypothetical protein GCM10010911_07970 [Paenibacillus nasutitermitis]
MKIYQSTIRIVMALTVIGTMMLFNHFPVHASDYTYDSFKKYDQSWNYGRGFSDPVLTADAADGGTVAWAQSYLLNGYVNSYHASKDNYWLDKIVDQTDRLLTNASTLGGTAKGWPSLYSYPMLDNRDFKFAGPLNGATEMVLNGGFETATGGIPNNWTRTGGSADVYVSTTEKFAGNQAIVIKYNGTGTPKLTQTITVAPNQEYTLSYYAKTNGYQTGAILSAVDTATGSVLANSKVSDMDPVVYHPNWERYAYNFTAPSSGSIRLEIALTFYQDTGWMAYFDQISVMAANASNAATIVQNASFETVNGSDSTLPQSWSRWQGSASTAYRSMLVTDGYDGTASAVIKANGTSWQTIEQTLAYTPNTVYTVKFSAKNNMSTAVGKVDVIDENNITYGSITFQNDTWSVYNFTFNAPSAAGHTLKLRLLQNDYTNNKWVTVYDSVNAYPVQQTSSASWELVNGNSANAYRTNQYSPNSNVPWGVVVSNSSTQSPYYKQRLLGYAAGTKHGLSVTAKALSGSTGRVTVYNETTGTEIARKDFAINEFGSFVLGFTTPSNTSDIVTIRIGLADNVNGHGAVYSNVNAGEYGFYMVHEGMIMNPVLNFVKLVQNDSSLHTAYLSKANAYKAFIVDNLYSKWESNWQDINASSGIYKQTNSNVGQSNPGKSLANNQYLSYGGALYLLYDVTSDSTYLNRANKMVTAFKNKLSTNASGGYQWNYWSNHGSWDNNFWFDDASVYSFVDDLTHSAVALTGPIEAYRHGQVFTQSDMIKFSKTFTDVMWNGSASPYLISHSLNTTGAYPIHYHSWTPYAGFWGMLAEVNASMKNIISGIVKDPKQSVYFPLTGTAALRWANENTMLNQGFEYTNPADSTLPLYWQRWQSTSATAYIDTVNFRSGSAGMTVKTNPAAGWQVLEQIVADYEPNTEYTLSFYARNNATPAKGRVDIVTDTTSALLTTVNFDSGTWTKYTATFRTPAAATEKLKIRLYHQDYAVSGGISYFDDVSLAPSLFHSAIPNGGFEYTEFSDPTLPKWWSRGGTTLESKAVVAPAFNYRGTQSLKLETSPANGVQELMYSWYGYKPSGNYTLKFSASLGAGSTTGGKIIVRDRTAGTDLATVTFTATGQFYDYSTTFTAPTSYDHELRVIIQHDNPAASGGVIYVDELGITL